MTETQPVPGRRGAASPAPETMTPRERLIQKEDLQRLQHVQGFMNKNGTIDIVNLGEIEATKLSDIAKILSKQMDSLTASSMDGRIFELVDHIENESSREVDTTKRNLSFFPKNEESPRAKRVRLDTLVKKTEIQKFQQSKDTVSS